jgi:hypothetical protein
MIYKNVLSKALIITICLFSICSCKSESNDNKKESTKKTPNVVGYWNSKSTTGYWNFDNNGSGYSYDSDTKEKETLTWKLENSGDDPKLLLKYSDNITVDYKIKDFTETEIVMVETTTGSKITLQKSKK